MTVIDARAVARSLRELNLYFELRPCPSCGSAKYAEGEFWEYVDEPTGTRRYAQNVTCQACQATRRFVLNAPGYRKWRSPDGTVWSIGDQSPSPLLTPGDFTRAYDAAIAGLAEGPDGLDFEAYSRALAARTRTLMCVTELLKFLPAGIDAIPDEHFTTQEDRAFRDAAPARFTRAYLEAEHDRLLGIHERFFADREHFWALQRAHAAANPPPPPPPFSKASLEAHRQWATAPKGTSAGRRLEATDTAQPNADLGAQSLEGSILTRVDLTGADLSFATAHHVRWTDVKLTRARLGSAHLYSSILTRCDFSEASLGLTRLGDGRIEDCSFARAQMDRSSWYRSDVARCDFRGAVFGQSACDSAVFVDCDFRGASLAMDPDGVMGTTKWAWFYRCDFRDVDWTGRWFYMSTFVDCHFGSPRGTPRQVADIQLFRCSLDPDGRPGTITAAELVSAWGLPAERYYDSADNVPRTQTRSLTRDELRDGRPVTWMYEDWSPLIQAEMERDPSSPRPVPWR